MFIIGCGNVRIREAKADNAQVIDVDGFFLYQKEKRLIDSGVVTSPLALPDPPLHGWEQLKADNHMHLSTKLPNIVCKRE